MTGRKSAGDGKPVWVVLICGLPGSGKTTLRRRLVANGWAYVNKDEMCTADSCEKALVKALKSGKSCVVDLCNVTSSERRLWFQHANRAVEKGIVKGVSLRFEAVWMATPPDVCKQRASNRVGHETISGEAAEFVIDQFCRGLRPPERSGQEPYEQVFFVESDEDADVIVRRYATPSLVDASVMLSRRPAGVAPLCRHVGAERAPSPFGEMAEHGNDNESGDVGYKGGPADPRTRYPKGTEIFIMRHGERADKARDSFEGPQDDPPLTREGREMAKRAGSALHAIADLPVVAVYSSPFYRCLQTANEVAAELGLPVRIEPGFSELCIERIFDHKPVLRKACTALLSALMRTSLDCSMPPVYPEMPQWPELACVANARVMKAARQIASRHRNQAVVFVCHAHSLIEMTRHLPASGGGKVGSRAGYCALTHISSRGDTLRCVDQTYLGTTTEASNQEKLASVEASFSDRSSQDVLWNHAWRWTGAWNGGSEGVQDKVEGEERNEGDEDGTVETGRGAATASGSQKCVGCLDEAEADDPVDALLQMDLDVVLERYAPFRQVFGRGSQDQQSAWRLGWSGGQEAMRHKVQAAYAKGLFA
eukprot:TRINITY_DN42942_c0_g1_i1.p1 TRINITY_DN42942_c0_g1~~TRINITY_DN42942_c0_g1_i1.p1  ORF type:complete len:595 (-),score=101.22 TRINITY_DN42942_c0_g1_i1:67-1851(-)